MATARVPESFTNRVAPALTVAATVGPPVRVPAPCNAKVPAYTVSAPVRMAGWGVVMLSRPPPYWYRFKI